MRQPDSKFQYIQQAPTDICLLVPLHLEKWGGTKKFVFVLYPYLKIRGAAPEHAAV